MARKVGRLAKSKRNRKTVKSGRAKKSARRSRKPAKNSTVPGKISMAASVRAPPPGRGKRGEKGYLGYLLRQAQAAARLTLERALDDLGVTPPQFAVLTMLKAYPGLSGADLARVALLTPQTVGVIIRNLERAGAIKKTPHPVHGRVLQWTLTRRGTALLGKCRRHVRALERRLAAGLTARSQVTVRHWLANLATALQREA
jgi:DNA-binding MarR family transcriptional regulator